jgi:hypothetical protein
VQPSFLGVRHLEKHLGDQLVFRREMPVERAGTELGAIQDGANAEPANSLFAQGF